MRDHKDVHQNRDSFTNNDEIQIGIAQLVCHFLHRMSVTKTVLKQSNGIFESQRIEIMAKNPNTPRRRIVLRSGLGMLAAGVGLGVSRALADDRLSHRLVEYQDGPKNGAMCGKCVQFVAPNACTIIVSPISPNGWCLAFAPPGG